MYAAAQQLRSSFSAATVCVGVYCASRIRHCPDEIMAQQGGSGGAGAAADEHPDVSVSPPRRVLTAHGSNPETPAKKFAKVCTGEVLDSSEDEATEPAPMGASSAQATEGDDAAESLADPPRAAVPPRSRRGG